MIHKEGLKQNEIIESRNKYGNNLLTPPITTPWLKLYLEKFQDPIIIILLVSTMISLIVGIIHGDFIELIGIICAILIATGVGFWQEYDAQKKFDAMKSDKDYEKVTVRRENIVIQISKDQLVVGDVIILTAGDEIPADIELFEATDMKVSEATMTGESKAVAKYPTNEKYTGSGFAPNLLLRGTTIEQGMGEGSVIAVGDNTEIGKTTRQASEDTKNKTPLEIQLNKLAEVGFLMSAVIVIIVAVPEGLPLSVTLALAFSMKTMVKENNLVKKMHACETIGAVNVIFTDKTGTLTQNSMSVVESDVEDKNKEIFTLIGALNSTANWSNENNAIGNPTDCAILKYIGHAESEKIRTDYNINSSIPFSSQYK